MHSAVFVATLITLLDCFALPSQHAYAADALSGRQLQDNRGGLPHVPTTRSGRDDDAGLDDGLRDPDADETTALMGPTASESGGSSSPRYGTTTFRTTIVDASRRSWADLINNRNNYKPFSREQPWSDALPSATWMLQFLVTAPIVVVLFGQVGLVMATSVAQAASDGSSLSLPYVISAAISMFTLLPLTPHIHRVTLHVPAVLAAVFIATATYNMLAFPFSVSRPNKFFFRQDFDMDSNASVVKIMGLEQYARLFVEVIPSAAGQDIKCEPSSFRLGLSQCTYEGAAVAPDLARANVTISRDASVLTVDGGDTKTCQLTLDEPVAHFHVAGTPQQLDDRFYTAPEHGVRIIVLNRRDRSVPWRVEITRKRHDDSDDGDDHENDGSVEHGGAIAGTLSCLWDDANKDGAIPAYDEALHYMPAWASLNKAETGLMWTNKRFEL